MKNLRHEGGFTLIELIMVIVILGLLAAVAIPRFTSLSTEATAAAEKGMLGGVRSGIATLHSAAIGKNACGPGFTPGSGGSSVDMTALSDGCWPISLDGAANAATAALFDNVIEQGGTSTSDNWTKTSVPAAVLGDTETYTGPAGTGYTYNNRTGTMS